MKYIFKIIIILFAFSLLHNTEKLKFSADTAQSSKNNNVITKVFKDNVEIIDGISTMVVNGHTEGQQLIKINGNGDSLVFCSDLIPLKSHIQLPWIMGYDLSAVLTLKEKEEFLNEAVEKKWWLWFYHDPSTIAVKIDYGKKYYEIIDEIKRDNINAK